jgi:L-rhamnose isomerase
MISSKLPKPTAESINHAYALAKAQFIALGVDTDKAIEQLKQIPISLHCWQADDVGGFEKPDAALSGGGIQTTGNYPGKARSIAELRADLEKVLTLIPGKKKVNLHAIYGDFGGKFVDRDQIGPEHFQSWIDWAKNLGIGLDFNATLFSHPKAAEGFTLSHPDQKIREFWIEHVVRCREITAAMGRALGTPAVHNLWIPDGSKDLPIDRAGYRNRLKESLDKIYIKSYPESQMRDAVEGKLFGIGSEAFVVGSHEFYLSYALNHNLIPTMDMGHYHPTESVADKISAVLPFNKELLLHVSRGVRWDSDHVVLMNDELRDLALEIVRSGKMDKIYLALDYFDASINRIGAYVTGSRAVLKTLLYALLEPISLLKETESAGNNFQRLALLEEMKSYPFGAVWDYYCMRSNTLVGTAWIAEVNEYEKQILSKRK